MFETATYNDCLMLEPFIRARWAFLETRSAAAVLRSVCPREWADIIDVRLASTTTAGKSNCRWTTARTDEILLSPARMPVCRHATLFSKSLVIQ